MQANDVASLISSLREVEQGKGFGGFKPSHAAESLLRPQHSDARAPKATPLRGVESPSINVEGASTKSTLGLHLAASKSKLMDPVDRGDESISSAALVQDIVNGSKLLNKTSHLPPHLQTFKKDFERLQEKKIKLPTIHQQLTPRTRKRISQLPPASAEEMSAVEKYVSLAKSISGSKAYDNLADAVTKSRIKAQRRQNNEPEKMTENEGKTRGGGGERVLMPLPALADLGLSQEDLTRHDSTAFFAKLEEYRKQDAIKASIALRWAPSGEDDLGSLASSLDAGGVSILGVGNSSSIAETRASKQYPFDSDLTSLLAQKASTGRKPPNESATQAKDQVQQQAGSSSTPDVYRKLYGSISETNERGQPMYDDQGNLHPKTLATSYSEVFEEASEVHGSISTRFQHLQQELTIAREHKMQFIKAEKSLLDEIKTRCYDDLGLDLDSKFTAVRIASKAVNMMMFYMIEVRLKGSFLKLKEQTRLASIARRERAARLINRVSRGMLARAEVRKLRRMIYVAREHERRTVETRNTEYRKAASCITRAIRLYTRMKIIRRRRRQRLAATCIQRRIRGIIARVRVYRLRNWNEWLRFNAVKIQCMARRRFARRRVAVLRKIRTVKTWEANAAISQKTKAEHLRRVGAAAYIIHCYRAYKIRRKLKIIIYWHRVELAIVIQKWVRGFFDRKFVKRIKRRKFERERIVREAAVAIQKIVRGRQARLNQYKPRLAIKVKELLAKRKAKNKYLKEAAKNNAMRVLYGTLRTFVPFRYIILARKATVIQRFYRGYRARKRVFLMKVQATITKMNRKYFGGFNGALQFQRVYRGYRYRRDKIRAKRKAAATLIQCAFRCSQARWKVMQKKIHRDAMIVIGKNILSLMRFKKAEKIRRENRKYRHIVVKLQRFARRYLGRVRFHNIKTDKRSQFERDKVNDLRLNHVLASIQLRIIMESIERPLGEKPESLCSSDCYALGPIQAIFCAAVGKKARLEHTALPTNKIDSSSILKFAAKIKGFMENGRPSYETVDDLYKPPKLEQGESGAAMKGTGTGGGQSSRLQSKGPKGPRGGGKGRKRVEKVKTRMHPPGQFALIDAIRSRAIDIISATKPLNKLDLEMVFAKSCEGGQKELRYPDFITFVRAAAKINYAVPDDDDTSVSTAAAQRAYEAKMANLSAERVDDATVDSSLADDSTVGGRWDDLTLEGDDDEDDDNNDGDKSAATAERAMKEKRREARLKKKKKQASKKQSKSRAKVGDGKLLWPLKDITSRTNPNHAVLLLITFLDSWRSQEWWLDLADWMEQEARARVAVYVKKMQNLYWHMKSAAFRALMRDRLGAKKRIEEYTQVVVIIQSWVRRFICKARVQRLAQVFLVKYIPDVGEPYWFNRSTNVTSYTRPLILGPYDCLSVAMPPTGLEFVIQCSNCTATAVRNCWECEDSYCKKCYDNLHCKGKRRFHHTYSIPMCGYCKFQMASKCCVTCMSIKPEPGSAQEQMKESDRGNLCDYCFSHLHDESEQHFWEDEGSIEKKENMRRIFARSREAYLVKHELGGGGKGSIVTDHKFDSTVQECEECNFRAASWRCNDCKQIYCNKCLVGLHSIGGPFSAHKAEKLPFYTGEMHKSFLNDQRAQIFQTKMEVVKRAWAQRADAFRYRSIVRIQAWWRMHFHGRKGRLHILRGRKKARRQWRLRIAEKAEREGLRYKFLDLFGMAPELLSDTREEQVLKRISVFGRQFAREYVWKNKDSWGFYTDNKDSKHHKKGEPNKGFEAGDIEELKSQARRGGFRMPGRILLRKGEQKHTTTHDLREFLKNGMLVRIGGAFFAVRHVSESSLRLDRIWRWESVLPDGELIYRLPAYSDEPRRYQYKALYYLANFAISNPISQSYFRTHASVFEQLKGAAEWMEQAHKTLGFRRGSVEWRRYASKLERRAKWAHDMIDEQVDAVDLSKQKSVKAKKPGVEGGGGAVAAALMAAAEAGEIALPEADSDDEGAENKPKERAPGERYYATEQELADRLAIEAAMSEEDLIATADDWEECIDVMTENIFYTNKNTHEMVADKPAALKLKIARDERLEKERKQVEEARMKMLSAKGLNAHGRKKGAAGMSGSRK